MGTDAPKGIDFGNIEYTVTKAKGNDPNGNFTVNGYLVKLKNGISFFMRENSEQDGARITSDNDKSNIYGNNVKFSGFKNITIFGSQERDKITVDDGKGVRVRTDNDHAADEVIFTNVKNQNNSWIGGKHDLRVRPHDTILCNDGKLEYREKFDPRIGGQYHDGYNYGEKPL